MTMPENPFTDSAASDAAADTAAAATAPASQAAAVPNSVCSGGPEQAPADTAAPTAAGADIDLDATDCIGEIFYVARKLLEDDRRRRFELNEQAFMEAVDEPLPLFLREKRE